MNKIYIFHYSIQNHEITMINLFFMLRKEGNTHLNFTSYVTNQGSTPSVSEK